MPQVPPKDVRLPATPVKVARTASRATPKEVNAAKPAAADATDTFGKAAHASAASPVAEATVSPPTPERVAGDPKEEYKAYAQRLKDPALSVDERIDDLNDLKAKPRVMRHVENGRGLANEALAACTAAKTPEAKADAEFIASGALNETNKAAVARLDRPHTECAVIFRQAISQVMKMRDPSPTLLPFALDCYLVCNGLVQRLPQHLDTVSKSNDPLAAARKVMHEEAKPAFGAWPLNNFNAALGRPDVGRGLDLCAIDLVLMAEAKKAGIELSPSDFGRDERILGALGQKLDEQVAGWNEAAAKGALPPLPEGESASTRPFDRALFLYNKLKPVGLGERYATAQQAIANLHEALG